MRCPFLSCGEVGFLCLKHTVLAIIASSDSHFEKILASFLNEGSVKLSPFQEDMKIRIKAAFTLLLNWKSREQASHFMQQQFGISQATAYRDIANALRIYGDVTKADKEGMCYLIIEYNQKTMQLAMQEKNLEQMGRCMDRMIKLAELDKDESLVNLEKLANMDIKITISKKAEAAIVAQNERGVVDLNNFEAEDTDFEEIEEEQNEG